MASTKSPARLLPSRFFPKQWYNQFSWSGGCGGRCIDRLYWQEHGINDVRHKGWLQRLSGRALQSWKPQLCVLTSSAVFFFDTEEDFKTGCWHCYVPNDALLSVSTGKGGSFTLHTSVRKHDLKVDDESTRRRWLEHLSAQTITPSTEKFSTLPLGMRDSTKYRKRHTLGKGGFSEVRLGVDVRTNEKVAIKRLKKASLPDNLLQRIYREIDCLSMLSHPNVVQLLHVLESNRHISLVLEYVSGPPLDVYAANFPASQVPEILSRDIFSQLLSAVRFCHDHYVVHRDIKMENVIITDPLNIKLIDFGFSRNFKSQTLETRCGTYEYTAPEVLRGVPYDGPSCDAWSMGVLLYALLGGAFPFASQEPAALEAEIYEKRSNLRVPALVSQDVHEVILGLLEIVPENRWKLSRVAQHRWFSQSVCSIGVHSSSLSESNIKSKVPF